MRALLFLQRSTRVAATGQLHVAIPKPALFARRQHELATADATNARDVLSFRYFYNHGCQTLGARFHLLEQKKI